MNKNKEENSYHQRAIIKTYLSDIHYPQGLMVSLNVIMVLGIFSHIFWHNWVSLMDYLPANPQQIFQQNEFWRVYTGILIHADTQHLMSNAFMLFILGQIIYSYYGPFLFPFLTFFMGGLINFISLLTYPSSITLIGSSGMVYFLAGLLPTLSILIDRRKSLFNRLFRAFTVSILLFFPLDYSLEISYRTHFIGFILGILIGIIYYHFNKTFFRSFDVTSQSEEAELF